MTLLWRRVGCAVAATLVLLPGLVRGRRLHADAVRPRPGASPAPRAATTVRQRAAAAMALLASAGGPQVATATAATAAGDSGDDTRVRWKTNLIGSPDVSQFWGHERTASWIPEEPLDAPEAKESPAFGSVRPAMKREAAHALLKELDVDGDGLLNQQEFVSGLSPTVTEPDKALLVAFVLLDQNEDNRLDTDELVHVGHGVRAAVIRESSFGLASAIMRLDKDGDGKISRHDLKAAIARGSLEGGSEVVMRNILGEFDRADRNGDTRLDEAELQWIIMSLVDRGDY